LGQSRTQSLPQSENSAQVAQPSNSAGAGEQGADSRALAWATLALLLLGALAIRLWGIRQGLPYVYNADENAHFVPHAIGMFGHDLNPHYFANPPAFTYLLHIVFAIYFGGRRALSHEFALHPGQVFLIARVTAATLGTVAVWLLYLVGARLFSRAVGLLAGALLAVAFLPVFYSHLALNDVPTLVPATLSMLGSAGVLRRGRWVDYLLAGVGLGLGCATKYTAGIMLLVLGAASAARFLSASRPSPRALIGGLSLAGGAAIVSFLIANPYAVLDFGSFHAGLVHQSTVSDEAQGKLGAPHESGIVYYLWSLTWGLGWMPTLAALGGALTVWRANPAIGWMLVPAPLLYLMFMGLENRYFGRWLLPIFPLLCILAAFFAVQILRQAQAFCARQLARRKRRGSRLAVSARLPSVMLAALALAALLGQGVLYSVHNDLVLSRADTRNTVRAWMAGHVPTGARIVVEPVVPGTWTQDIGHPTLQSANGDRWVRYPSLRILLPTKDLPVSHSVRVEDYERTLSPALLDYYRQHGYCWVLSGSTQSGRALADDKAVPSALAYYRALAEQARVLYRVTPYGSGQRSVAFNFDWSFDYYPLAYQRPGPAMTVYRLLGGRCAAS
jgi:4-amino-4-deoxy-L-arabinose transferase-like glycosyltransferase